MRMYDIILKKRYGKQLTNEEIAFFIKGYSDGSIPDYQASAMTMAICCKGMSDKETAALTNSMAKSGHMVDLSAIPGIKVDKHSTGGVGDKTSLVIGPIVAACGIPVAKMSGRGLGHTGGTLDKLESIPGLSVELSQEAFVEQVRAIGLAIIGQTGDIAPADKKLYALRDVTATVDNLPLIASSIMSKKLAAGSDAILLDVKTGSGAFMKTLDDSIDLAKAMVAIGEENGRATAALITEMDRPLGNAIGNSLEVIEAVNTLKGKGPSDLTEVCLDLAANMLLLAEQKQKRSTSLADCRKKAEKALADGLALKKLIQMVEAQGGKKAVIENTDLFTKAAITCDVLSAESGWIHHMDTEQCGIASVGLGAGRITKDEAIDFAAGIVLHKKTGDAVQKGDVLATLYTNRKDAIEDAKQLLLAAISISNNKPVNNPLVLARVTKDGVERM